MALAALCCAPIPRARADHFEPAVEQIETGAEQDEPGEISPLESDSDSDVNGASRQALDMHLELAGGDAEERDGAVETDGEEGKAASLDDASDAPSREAKDMDAEADPDALESPSRLAIELEVATSAGTRGEGAVDARLHLERGPYSLALGFGSGGGTEAVPREWLRAKAGWDPGVAFSLGALLQPEQSGAFQEQLELDVSTELADTSWQLELIQQRAQLTASAAGFSRSAMASSETAMAFSGATASLESSRALSTLVRATAHAGFGLFSLEAPRNSALPWQALTPWDRLGMRELAWPSRADGALGLSFEGAPGLCGFSLGAGLPAAAFDLEGEATISCERAFGRATFSLALSAAHLWPNDEWLFALAFSARWKISRP